MTSPGSVNPAAILPSGIRRLPISTTFKFKSSTTAATACPASCTAYEPQVVRVISVDGRVLDSASTAAATPRQASGLFHDVLLVGRHSSKSRSRSAYVYCPRTPSTPCDRARIDLSSPLPSPSGRVIDSRGSASGRSAATVSAAWTGPGHFDRRGTPPTRHPDTKPVLDFPGDRGL